MNPHLQSVLVGAVIGLAVPALFWGGYILGYRAAFIKANKMFDAIVKKPKP